MDSVYLLRIGPIDGAPQESRFLYVPVFDDVALENLTFAPDDATGIDRIRSGLRTASILCHPALADAAHRLGLPVREPSREMSELRADLALSLGSDSTLPVTRPVVLRRIFLRGLGAFNQAFTWNALLLYGARASAHVAGTILSCESETTVALQLIDAGIPRLVASFPAPSKLGLPTEDAISVQLFDGPAYVVEALQEAYGLRFCPRFEDFQANEHPTGLANFYAIVGHTLHSLGLLGPGGRTMDTTLDLEQVVRLATRMDFIPAAN